MFPVTAGVPILMQKNNVRGMEIRLHCNAAGMDNLHLNSTTQTLGLLFQQFSPDFFFTEVRILWEKN